MAAKKTPGTMDLFTDWAPPAVNASFPPTKIKGADISSQVCRALKMALEDCQLSRDEIAEIMSAYLGETVSKTMIDAYVSQAKEAHTINLPRFAAFVHATGDMRLLSLLPDLFGHAVIPEKYISAVNEAITTDQIETLQKKKTKFRREWKGGGS